MTISANWFLLCDLIGHLLSDYNYSLLYKYLISYVAPTSKNVTKWIHSMQLNRIRPISKTVQVDPWHKPWAYSHTDRNDDLFGWYKTTDKNIWINACYIITSVPVNRYVFKTISITGK